MNKPPKPSPEDSLYGSIEDDLQEPEEPKTEEEEEGWDDSEDDRLPVLPTALIICGITIVVGMVCWFLLRALLG